MDHVGVPTESPVVNRHQKTVLLVEDDWIIARATVHQLMNAGYRVIHVDRGETAVARVVAETNLFDLVVMDVALGDGIDGIEAASRIVAHVQIPIVFRSSLSERELQKRATGRFSYGFVPKASGEWPLLRFLESEVSWGIETDE